MVDVMPVAVADASNDPVPTWLADVRDRFRQDLGREGASKSTQSGYPKRAQQFVAWCLANFGLDRSRWPIDAPARWYATKGWTGKSQMYGNIVSSALRAAMRWDRSQSGGAGFDIPDVNFPPSVAPPKRRPRTQEMQMSDLETVPSPAFAPESAVVVAPTSDPPVAVTAMPGYLPPQVETASPGMSERPLSRPRTVDKRQHVRNSLGALLPPGGKLKIYRVSDGTDNAYPGERVLFSEPTEKDVRGYNDIATWIKDSIHDVKPALSGPRTVNTLYIVEQYDDQERLLPPPRRVILSNGSGGTGAQANGSGAAPLTIVPPPPPGGVVDEVMKGFVRKMERMDTWQEEQIRAHREVVDKARTGDINGAQMQWFMAQKPAPFDVKTIIEDVVSKVSDIVNKARDVAPAPMPLMPALPPPKDPFDSPLMSQLVAAATKREIPAAAAPDPIAQMTAMVGLIRPPVDPAVTALQSQVNALINELRDAKAKSPQNDPMNFFTMMKAMDDVMDRRIQKFGGNDTSVGSAIAAAITALPETIKALADSGAIQPRPDRPGVKTAPAQQQQQAQGKLLAATPAQIAALRGLLEGAQKGDDATVLNQVMALIVANGAAPAPWPELNKELYQAIAQEVTTVDEMGLVVQRLYGLPAFGGGALLKEFPGAIRRATDILAWNFPGICTKLKVPPRELIGIEAQTGAVQTELKEVPVEESSEEGAPEAEPVVEKATA